jgi:hypothetical protein
MTIEEMKSQLRNSIQHYYHRDVIIAMLDKLTQSKKQPTLFDNL